MNADGTPNVVFMSDLLDHTAVLAKTVMLTGAQLELNKVDAYPVS